MVTFDFKLGNWFVGFQHKMHQDRERIEAICDAITQIDNDESIFTKDKKFIIGLLQDLIKLKEICGNNPKEFGKFIFNTTDDNSYLNNSEDGRL